MKGILGILVCVSGLWLGGCGSDGDSDENWEGINIRIAAGNLTSGSQQTYDPGHGARIFQAIKPDIVLIQEFNYNGGPIRDFVDETFGTEYDFYRGSESDGGITRIPNGIISKYPILEKGQWVAVTRDENGSEEPAYDDRMYAWAVLDIPGDRDLLAVSVHLHTTNHGMEMTPLSEKISAKQKEGNYYVVLGGDFNTKDSGSSMRSTVTGNALMSSIFSTGGSYPVDQKGSENTNAPRTAPLDWVLLDKSLSKYEVSVEIGGRKYRHGHVFDSRVYDELGEIELVPPVKSQDSGAMSMQHMAVVKEVRIPAQP